MIDQISIRETFGISELSRVHSLRFDVLRKPLGLPFESVGFVNDESNETLHLLALSNENVIGCLSLLPPDSTDQIQLRGMAVSSKHQGQGVGKLLLMHAHSVAEKNGKALWCNARQSAIGFYQHHNWKLVGSLFEIPVIGLHSVMNWQPPIQKMDLN